MFTTRQLKKRRPKPQIAKATEHRQRPPRRYRVYFNKSKEAPQVWSVDEGDTRTEINVRAFIIETTTVSRYNGAAAYPEPKAWTELVGFLAIVDGIAVLSAEEK
ncbi:MAG TPA: hypothetical protein VJV74_02520 [Terriglobia bacterium]|nr:hypothetical protein [Terriglobia bacterium]